MTAWIIIGAIVLLFAFLLNSKIRAEIQFIEGKFDLKVKYLFFTIFPTKEKPNRKKREKKSKKSTKSEKAKKSKPSGNKRSSEQPADGEIAAETDVSESTADGEDEETDEEALSGDKKDKEKKTLSQRIEGISDTIEKIQIIWNSSKKGLKKLFVHIYIEGLMIDFLITGEDACKAALNYGRISTAVYNVIGFLKACCRRTTVKTVDMVCDFTGEKSKYDLAVKITVTPGIILSAVFMILFGLLINLKKLLKKPQNQPDENEAVTA